MRQFLLSVALAATAALASTVVACGNSPVLAAAGQTSSVPKKIATEEYLEKAAAGDLFEVESGHLATLRGASADVKEFGRMMTKDHAVSTQKIRDAATKSPAWKVPPALMNAKQQTTMRRLEEAEGQQFDKLYIDAQIEAHREALELHRSYAATGDDASLKQAATAIVPVVESHLAQLQKMTSAKAQ